MEGGTLISARSVHFGSRAGFLFPTQLCHLGLQDAADPVSRQIDQGDGDSQSPGDGSGGNALELRHLEDEELPCRDP
jgi:hypothetical protein